MPPNAHATSRTSMSIKDVRTKYALLQGLSLGTYLFVKVPEPGDNGDTSTRRQQELWKRHLFTGFSGGLFLRFVSSFMYKLYIHDTMLRSFGRRRTSHTRIGLAYMLTNSRSLITFTIRTTIAKIASTIFSISSLVIYPSLSKS